MMRTTEDLITYANKIKVSDHASFIKKSFNADEDVSEIIKENKLVVVSEKNEQDIYFQIDGYINSKIKRETDNNYNRYAWMGYTAILEEEVEAVYLSLEEIILIFKLNLTEFPHLEDYRNNFVLGCLTSLRFSDFSKLDQQDLRSDILYVKQAKSDNWVVIPLRKVTRDILIKRFEKNVSNSMNAEFNRRIKTIAQLAGLTQLVKHSYKKGNKTIVELKPNTQLSRLILAGVRFVRMNF